MMKLTMRQRGKRVSFLSWLLGWVAFSIRLRPLSAQDSEYNTRTAVCTSDGVTLGYSTLEELNLDIQEERTRIEGGGEPYNPYLFTLCPQTVFDAEGNTIIPSLNNILIGCGAPPVSTNQCVLLNGDVQVTIGDFLDTSIPVETVRLSGMTFSSFTGSAIAGDASIGTRVELFDSIFENFQSSFVILQQTADDNPVAPFEVQMRTTTVVDGTAGTFFANDGGVLRIVDMTASNVNAAGAFVSTEGSEAATFLSEVVVSASDINEIFTALNGAELDASDVKVSGMTAFRRIFSVSGDIDAEEVSRLDLRESEFSGNSATAEGAQWVAVDARNNAIVTVTNTTISDNSGAEHLFSASQSAVITLQKVDVTNTFGALPITEDLVTTVGFANTNSDISWSDSTWNNVGEFTAGLFAVFESNINAQRVCIDGTRLEAVVFISDDSTYTESDNYIENLESDACPEEGLRLAKENEGGGCFDPGNTSPCTPNCEAFATADNCLTTAQVSPAPATPVPTTSPGVSTAQVSEAPSTFIPTTTGGGDTVAPTGADGTTASPTGLRQGSDQPSSVPTDESQPPDVSIAPSVSGTPNVTALPTLEGTGNETNRPSDMPSQLPTIVGTTVAPTTSGTVPTGSPRPTTDSNLTSIAPSPSVTGEGTEEPSGVSNATAGPSGESTGSPRPSTSGTTEPPDPSTGSPFPTGTTPRDVPTGSPAPSGGQGRPSSSPFPTSTPGDRPSDTPDPESGSPTSEATVEESSSQPSPLTTSSPIQGSQTPSIEPSPGAPSTVPSALPSSDPIALPSTMPSITPSVGSTILPSSLPSGRPTASPTMKPTKCRERPIVGKGKGADESSSSDSSSSSSEHHKSKKHDKHHHKSKKSKHHHRILQNGMQHRLYEKEGRQNHLLPKQSKHHDRLLKKSKKDKGKGYDYVEKVIVIHHPPPDDEYWDLPYCD